MPQSILPSAADIRPLSKFETARSAFVENPPSDLSAVDQNLDLPLKMAETIVFQNLGTKSSPSKHERERENSPVSQPITECALFGIEESSRKDLAQCAPSNLKLSPSTNRASRWSDRSEAENSDAEDSPTENSVVRVPDMDSHDYPPTPPTELPASQTLARKETATELLVEHVGSQLASAAIITESNPNLTGSIQNSLLRHTYSPAHFMENKSMSDDDGKKFGVESPRVLACSLVDVNPPSPEFGLESPQRPSSQDQPSFEEPFFLNVSDMESEKEYLPRALQTGNDFSPAGARKARRERLRD